MIMGRTICVKRRQGVLSAARLITLGITVWVSPYATAQTGPVHVQLNFTESTSLDAGLQASIAACFGGKFTGVSDLTTGTGGSAGAAKTLRVRFVDVPPPRPLYGISDKKTCEAIVYVQTYLMFPSGRFNTAMPAGRTALANGLCETAAHETGHLLCSTHTQDAPTTREVQLDNGAIITGNGQPVSIMTRGDLITESDDAADAHTFTMNSLAEIQAAVNYIRDGGESWDLRAAFRCERCVQMVGGQYLDEVFIDGSMIADPVRRDDIVAVRVMIAGNPSFEFGWFNSLEEFFAAADPGSSGKTLEFRPGDMVEFGLRGAPGSAFDGEIFPFSDFGRLADEALPIPGFKAVTPALMTDYFQQVALEFDLQVIGGPVVTVTLSTNESSGTDGMRIVDGGSAPIPELSLLGLLSMIAIFSVGGVALIWLGQGAE